MCIIALHDLQLRTGIDGGAERCGTSGGAGRGRSREVFREVASGAKTDRTQLHRLAEFERNLIRARTGEGYAKAKVRGVKLGPPFKLTPHRRREALARHETGETLTDIGRSCNVNHSTISRLRPTGQVACLT